MPASCISLYLSRSRSENNVPRLKRNINVDHLNDRVHDGQKETTLTGFLSGSSDSVIVPLMGYLEYLVCEYLIKKGFSNEDVQINKATQSVWYGVIDGCQLRDALVELSVELLRKWVDLIWRVLVVRSGSTLAEYTKLARVKDERCKSTNHFESTMYELLKGLREINDDMWAYLYRSGNKKRKNVKVNHLEAACAYDDSDNHKTQPPNKHLLFRFGLSRIL